MPSPSAGVVQEIFVPTGATITSGTVLAMINAREESPRRRSSSPSPRPKVLAWCVRPTATLPVRIAILLAFSWEMLSNGIHGFLQAVAVTRVVVAVYGLVAFIFVGIFGPGFPM